jgi:ubiquitin thioesterase OTU1
MLEAETGIPAEIIRILSGFPPKPLALDDPTLTLAALGMQNGDTVIVQKGEARDLKRGHSDGKYVPPSNPRGVFVRRVVPSDNSCLFHACAYVLENRSRDAGPSLRLKVAEVVAAHPQKFTTAFLGRPNPEYCMWIQDPRAWGGAIELSILAFIYQTEIVALDLSSSRIDRYGQSENYITRAFVVYTGNHYDAMAVAEQFGASELQDQVLFNSRDEKVLKNAVDFVRSFKP